MFIADKYKKRAANAAPFYKDLKSIITYRKKYGCDIGYSDHTIGSEFAIASIALGCVLIEKHFTINSENTIDSAFSANQKVLNNISKGIKNIYDGLGTGKIELSKKLRMNLNQMKRT